MSQIQSEITCEICNCNSLDLTECQNCGDLFCPECKSEMTDEECKVCYPEDLDDDEDDDWDDCDEEDEEDDDDWDDYDGGLD